MNIFPSKKESATEIVIEQSAIGTLIGFSLMGIAYVFAEQLGSLAGIIVIIGYVFMGIHFYRSIRMNSVVKKAMKSGANVKMSGSVFNFKNPAEYRINKSEL